MSIIVVMDLKKLGQVLREKREALGPVPLAVVARRAGMGRATLWALERGENPKTGKPSRPAKDKLERVTEVLRLEPAEAEELLELAGYTTAMVPTTQRQTIHQAAQKTSGERKRQGFRFGSALPVVAQSRADMLRDVLQQLEEVAETIRELLGSEDQKE